MAQSRSRPTASNKPGGKPGAKPGSVPPKVAAAPGRPPARKPGKSIVNQKQTPWGLIWTTVAIVVFAAVVVAAVVITKKDDGSSAAEAGSRVDQCSEMKGNSSTSYLNENVCASEIKGIVFRSEADRTHVFKPVQYDMTPPIGGNHSQVWADCDGTVYDAPIANENAVHMLEHGAIWITYNAKTISPGDLATLKKLVDGQPRMALSPYPNLDSPISLQSWGYQLKVDSASDPRVEQFINVLRYNPKTTPEYGAICSDPSFKLNPSTFGHPLFG